jgi:hypothetical protein
LGDAVYADGFDFTDGAAQVRLSLSLSLSLGNLTQTFVFQTWIDESLTQLESHTELVTPVRFENQCLRLFLRFIDFVFCVD